jgi:hypothetical protein
MSTFEKVFCATLYEKGKEITAESLKGDPGDVLSNDITKGADGIDGNLSMVEVVTAAGDVSTTIPNPVDSNFSVYRIRKPKDTINNLIVLDHNSNQFALLYKEFEQTVTFFKRDNEWVL